MGEHFVVSGDLTDYTKLVDFVVDYSEVRKMQP